MADKERLDVILVNRGLAPSREMAKAIIMSGDVYVNGQMVEKSGTSILVDSEIDVKSNKMKYVSRGGLKLEKALDVFGIELANKVCMDVGASTGGFTDLMLQRGAAKVFAVDVGYGQLDWKIRNDNRVKVMEKTNARYLTAESIDGECHFASVDVSFISLDKILPIFAAENGILLSDGEAVCLIKPQFECGKKYVGKKGVVKEKFVHTYVINKVIDNGEQNGLYTKEVDYSPIKGPNGNIEYLIHFVKDESLKNLIAVDRVVDIAHEML